MIFIGVELLEEILRKELGTDFDDQTLELL